MADYPGVSSTSGIQTDVSELAVFVNNAISTLGEIEQTILSMDQKMANSLNDKSGIARDHMAQTWVSIFNSLKSQVNALGDSLNGANVVQKSTEEYNSGY